MKSKLLRIALASLIVFCVESEITRAQDLLAYGKECAAKIAPVPQFDCRKGTIALVTVNGVVPSSYQPNMACDRPSILPYGSAAAGQCVPYSRALVLLDDGRNQISAFCREKQIRMSGTFYYDEIDVIEHSVASGKTCWFQATGASPSQPVNGSQVPPPDTPPGALFWNSPQQTASEKCVNCHDGGPFVYSPFIAQTGQMPQDPLGNYSNDIGAFFKAWPKPMAVSTPGNTCVGCHRIGAMNSCATMIHQATGQSVPNESQWAMTYPNSYWMPPGNWLTHDAWVVAYLDSVQKLAACCANPTAEGCTVSQIPSQP